MSEIAAITEKVLQFRDERDWKQFHNPKDVAISLALEAAEVLELFQWLSPQELAKFTKEGRDQIGEELADVAKNLLLLAHEVGVDLPTAIEKKMAKDREKYPVDKCYGNHKKYNQI